MIDVVMDAVRAENQAEKYCFSLLSPLLQRKERLEWLLEHELVIRPRASCSKTAIRLLNLSVCVDFIKKSSEKILFGTGRLLCVETVVAPLRVSHLPRSIITYIKGTIQVWHNLIRGRPLGNQYYKEVIFYG